MSDGAWRAQVKCEVSKEWIVLISEEREKRNDVDVSLCRPSYKMLADVLE